MPRVLIVDDESQIRELVATIVRRVDPSADVENAASAAYAHVLDEQGFDPDLTITDWDMTEKGDGAEVVKLVHNKPIPSKIIVISGRPIGAEAMALGADLFLQKPYHLEEMMTAVRGLLNNQS